MKMDYRILFGDCNPSFPEHFLCNYDDNDEPPPRSGIRTDSAHSQPCTVLWRAITRQHLALNTSTRRSKVSQATQL